MNFFNQYYKNIIKYDLLNKFNSKNIKQLPKLEKIMISFTTKNITIKTILTVIIALQIITSQKNFTSALQSSNVSFKIKHGNLVRCTLTLRKNNMYNFFIKLFIQILPYLTKKFNYSVLLKNTFYFTLKNILLFTELENQYKIFNRLNNLEIIICTNCNSYNELFFLLKSFKF